MNVDILTKKLDDPEFYKKNIPNILFFFSTWKKDFERYKNADSRKVVPNYLLRRSEHEDFFYNTYALSTEGEIDAEVVEKLKAVAQQLELGEIRYMSHATNGFFPLIDESGVVVDAPELKLGENILLFSISDTKPAKIDCPYSVVVKKGITASKWPLSQTILSAI